MEKIQAQKVYYEIQGLLGSGLTSDVYKAFRVDGKGLTSQPVALKVIKSRNDVQILKKEFESLLRVRSKYCVNILAWESLKQGPALVLEFIDGITLDQLSARNRLTDSLIVEVIAQVHMGLRALHKHPVFHGDLNLKNIMINSEGIIKLIDFGFQGDDGTQCLTPQFSSPERKSGQTPDENSDLYSLEKISEYLFDQWGLHSTGQGLSVEKKVLEKVKLSLKATSRAARRRSLAKIVQTIKMAKIPSTRRIERKRKNDFRHWSLKWGVSSLAFWVAIVFPLVHSYEPLYSRLSARGEKWFKVSINEMPYRYGPIVSQKLRAGKYKIRWQDAQQSKESWVDLNNHQTFLLQPDANSL